MYTENKHTPISKIYFLILSPYTETVAFCPYKFLILLYKKKNSIIFFDLVAEAFGRLLLTEQLAVFRAE